MTQETEIAATLQSLRPLLGVWEGTGRGDYPTIDAFRYTERLSFVTNDVQPLIQYEQRTWFLSDGADHGEPVHWETGFVRPMGQGRVEMSNAQTGDRVEVLTGSIVQRDDGLILTLESILLGHDERLVCAQREYTLRGDRLHYVVDMATKTNPTLDRHLEAELTRKR